MPAETALKTLFLPFRESPELLQDVKRAFFLNARDCDDLSLFDDITLVCEQPFYPLHAALEKTKFETVKRLNEEEEQNAFDLGLMLLTQSKDENLSNMARAMTMLKPDATLVCCGQNGMGARRFEKHLAQLADQKPHAIFKNKSRCFRVVKTDALDQKRLEEWQRLGRFRDIHKGVFTSAPGIFSWDRIDAGSELLAANLPYEHLRGKAADMGCGYGYLSYVLLDHAGGIGELHCFEAHARALEACEKNLLTFAARVDLHYHWCDVTAGLAEGDFDVVISNPPFHEGQKADPLTIGGGFITSAHKALRKAGRFYMVANKHLPYEKIIERSFGKFETVDQTRSFKVLMARK